MANGTIKWFDDKKGFGFIEDPSAKTDVFVHYSDIEGEKGYRTLKEGDKVEYELVSEGPRGLKAKKVRKL